MDAQVYVYPVEVLPLRLGQNVAERHQEGLLLPIASASGLESIKCRDDLLQRGRRFETQPGPRAWGSGEVLDALVKGFVVHSDELRIS